MNHGFLDLSLFPEFFVRVIFRFKGTAHLDPLLSAGFGA